MNKNICYGCVVLLIKVYTFLFFSFLFIYIYIWIHLLSDTRLIIPPPLHSMLSILLCIIIRKIYIYTLLVCLFVSNKTDKPIGPKFCVGLHMYTGKVYRWSKFQKLISNKIRLLFNFENPLNFFYKIRKLFCLLLYYNVYSENYVNYWNRSLASKWNVNTM